MPTATACASPGSSRGRAAGWRPSGTGGSSTGRAAAASDATSCTTWSTTAGRRTRPSCGSARSGSAAADLVVVGRRPEPDALELAGGGAAHAERGLEAVLAELPRVEPAAQLVERVAVLVGDLVAPDLEQDQVARPAEAVRDAHEALALRGVEPVRGQHDGVAGLEPLLGGRVQ